MRTNDHLWCWHFRRFVSEAVESCSNMYIKMRPTGNLNITCSGSVQACQNMTIIAIDSLVKLDCTATGNKNCDNINLSVNNGSELILSCSPSCTNININGLDSSNIKLAGFCSATSNCTVNVDDTTFIYNNATDWNVHCKCKYILRTSS